MKTIIQSLNSWRLLGFSALSGGMLVLIFPRFDLEWMAWVALVPLFFSIQHAPLPRVALRGFVCGMVFYFFGLHWVTNTLVNYGNIPIPLSYLILILLAAYLSFYLSLFCVLVRKFSRGDPLFFLLLAPVVWTALEYLRSSHPVYGFSWLGLGYSQYLFLPAIQMAEFTGVYGISTLIVWVNASVHYLLQGWLRADPASSPSWFPGRVAGCTALVLIFWIGYGITALNRIDASPPAGDRLKVGLAQGNIEQGIKWNPKYRDHVMQAYRDLTLKAAGSRPDLIVWPEAATPFFYNQDREPTQQVNQLVRQSGAPLLLGSPYREVRDETLIHFNSAYLISADGEPRARYDKIHLVPFGEFVPFQEVLWFVQKLVVGVGDFGRGETLTVFRLDGHPFSVFICYEITFPNLVRRAIQNGAVFLVNITNDAWFGQSAAPYQHIAMASLRAVENRVPLVRAANTGISGKIDPTGRIAQASDLFVKDLVLTEIAPSTNGSTPYARYGDVFAWACLGLSVLLPFLAPRGEDPSGVPPLSRSS